MLYHALLETDTKEKINNTGLVFLKIWYFAHHEFFALIFSFLIALKYLFTAQFFDTPLNSALEASV